MILPDVNLLVYAHDATSMRHREAHQWWEDKLNGTQMIALSWVGLLGFIRLMTNHRVFQNPYEPKEILAIVRVWMTLPHVKIVHPGDGHFTLFAELIEKIGTAGNLTTDAHLAALAIERGLILQTTDADFARFPGLKWINPLVAR